MNTMRRIATLGLLAAAGFLAACQSQPVSKPTGNVKIGKPYVIDGKTYYPEFDESYDRMGTASWYGPGFHGKYTANGEVFNENDLTAAHPTLPMPSLVRVTNVQNGKSAVIRVNDRGPFKDNRIIDLSKKSAERLGIQGLAKVRVQFLRRETEEYLAAIRSGHDFNMFAYNDQPPEVKIVETVRYSSYDDTDGVSEAAPVLSVSSVETIETIETPPATRPVELIAANEPVPGGVISSAWADDNVTLPEPSSPPPAAVASARSGKFTIQAGAFSSEANAQKLMNRLSSIGAGSIDTIESAGRMLWRVRVGAFADHASASTALSEVRLAGIKDARIVRK